MDSKIKYSAFALVTAGMMLHCSSSTNTSDKASAVVKQAMRTFNQPLAGAIFTTLDDGSRVNANIYEAKEDVYLDGGPGPHAPASAAGLPAGDYYFQVTDPSGQDLLSDDHISCRRITVNDAGVIARSLSGTSYEWRAGAWVAVPCQHQTGIDQDHAADGAITVQLMPYDDTPNTGGVYKVWITPVGGYTGDPNLVPQEEDDAVNGEMWAPGNFHGFVPAQSKTDNFKVRGDGDNGEDGDGDGDGVPRDQPILIIRKFHDANVNATLDLGEEEIEGWRMTVNDPLGASNDYFTPAIVLVDAGRWSVLEDTPSGTEITAAYRDGVLLSRYPTANPLVTVDVAGEDGESHEVLFGDVCVGEARACKIYDVNANGVVDRDEVGVSGWRLRLTGTDVRGTELGPIEQVTGEDGCTTFGDLLPGSYMIAELTSGGEWLSSGPTSSSFQITSTLREATLSCTEIDTSFTNYCRVTVDFDTKGYWHNKNGLAEITEADIAYINGLRPYASPSTYFGDGDEPFDDKDELSRFLVDANAGGDPREQLAQQLLAFILNARHRLGGIAGSILQPDDTWLSASELIDEAIAAWESGSANERRSIASRLDAYNNDNAIVAIPAIPCALP